jgi:trans-aconitate methyltransferase
MNLYLRDFVKQNFPSPGQALDLGAGEFFDVAGLRQMGWAADGVDLTTGVDLEEPYASPAAPFDLVYSNYVIQKLDGQEQLLATAHANLRPGGWLFLHTFDVSDENSRSELTPDSIAAMLRAQGFRSIAVRLIDFYDNEPRHQHWHKLLEATAQK